MTAATSSRPGRKETTVLRLWDWSLPPTAVRREVIADVPADWPEAPRAERRPPLLFVHGLAHGAWCFAEHWLPAAASQGYPSYAVSLRGHGGSEGGRRLTRTLTRDYVHDVLQTIVELPEPPVLVGHSMGALIAQLVADRYPVRALVLLTPAPATGALPTLLGIARSRPLDALRTLAGGTLPMRPELLFEGLDGTTARGYAARTGRESPLVQYELLRRRRIGPVRAPVLVVGTPEDQIVRMADVESTAAMYGVAPVWLPGMGHDVMLDAGWEDALTLVLDWVDEACPPGTPPLR